jgi:hypothetical protein
MGTAGLAEHERPGARLSHQGKGICDVPSQVGQDHRPGARLADPDDLRQRQPCSGRGQDPLRNYIVETSGPDGQTVRLEVEQHIETIDVSVGSQVPLLLSPDGTKAVFDHKDPSINVIAVTKAAKNTDKDRFRSQLGG